MRKVSERAEPQRRGPGAEPGRGAAAFPRGPPAAGERQPRLPLHRVAAARSRSPAGQLLQHPAEAEPAHHRHAQRVQLHARQQVQRGPAQDAVRAGEPRRGVDRERAPVREPRRREQGPHARQRVAGGELQADDHRLRARAGGVGPLHARPFRARRDVRAPDRDRPQDERPRDRHRREGRPDARRRQDRRAQRQAEQARQADARRAGDVPVAPRQGQAHPGADPVHARHRPRLLLPPRGVGRLGLPAGADGRSHPADRPHRRDRRRLRRDDVRPRLPQGAAARDRVRRAGTLRGLAVRPGDRPGVPVPDRGVPEGQIEEFRKIEAIAGRFIPR